MRMHLFLHDVEEAVVVDLRGSDSKAMSDGLLLYWNREPVKTP